MADAVNSLIARGAQAIWIGGDNTVIAGDRSGHRHRAARPTSRCSRSCPARPTAARCSTRAPTSIEVGRQGGFLAADVLEGADIAKIPIRDVLDLVPAFLSVNMTALKGLKEPWRVPDDVLARASVVGGRDRRAQESDAATPPATGRRSQTAVEKWRLSLIELNRVAEVEEAEQGVLDGLKESGLVDGRDYEYTIRNAQGDMATVSGLIDAAIADGADMLDHVFDADAAGRAPARRRRIPIVFNYVADPFVAGAGKSDHGSRCPT